MKLISSEAFASLLILARFAQGLGLKETETTVPENVVGARDLNEDEFWNAFVETETSFMRAGKPRHRRYALAGGCARASFSARSTPQSAAVP